jgi:hypothetical protein
MGEYLELKHSEDIQTHMGGTCVFERTCAIKSLGMLLSSTHATLHTLSTPLSSLRMLLQMLLYAAAWLTCIRAVVPPVYTNKHTTSL